MVKTRAENEKKAEEGRRRIPQQIDWIAAEVRALRSLAEAIIEEEWDVEAVRTAAAIQYLATIEDIDRDRERQCDLPLR